MDLDPKKQKQIEDEMRRRSGLELRPQENIYEPSGSPSYGPKADMMYNPRIEQARRDAILNMLDSNKQRQQEQFQQENLPQPDIQEQDATFMKLRQQLQPK